MNSTIRCAETDVYKYPDVLQVYIIIENFSSRKGILTFKLFLLDSSILLSDSKRETWAEYTSRKYGNGLYTCNYS